MIWLVLIATTAAQALATLAMLAIPVIAPTIAAAFGIDASLIGLQVSIVYGGAMATSIIGGTLDRKWGAVRSSQAALGFGAAGLLLALLPWLASLALGSLFIGFAYGLTNPAAAHLLTRYTPPNRRNLIFSIKQSAVPLGGMLAGLLIPPLTEAYGWRWAFAVSAASLALLAVLLQSGRKAWDNDREPHLKLHVNPFAGLSVTWQNQRVRWLSGCGFFYSAVQMCVASFLVTFLVHEIDFSLIEAGLVMAMMQAGGVVGRMSWGWMADLIKNGQKVLMIIGCIAILGSIACFFLTPATPQILVKTVFVTLGFTAIGWNGVYLAEVARSVPKEQVSIATGGTLFFTFMGVFFGPTLFSFAYGFTQNYTATYAGLGLVTLAGMAMVWKSRKS
ncbi:Major facilitator superfamily protein [Rhodospirillaceae bacterium LM-1]|nr:Major facilitator superfamily protein [Rhodospirillaceae bacterium LM-1]